MISEYDNRVRVPFKIMPPCFQGTDNGEEFTIIDLVIPFSGVKGLREVSTGVICSVLISLE
jgi:hypothetical protein